MKRNLKLISMLMVFVMFIVAFAGCSNKKKGLFTEEIVPNIGFNDQSEISEYATTAIAYLTDSGAISGIGSNLFAPKQACTRAETAKMLYNVFYK